MSIMSRPELIGLTVPWLVAAVAAWAWWRTRRRRVRIAGLRGEDTVALGALLHGSPVAACVTDAGTIRFVNRAMVELHGATPHGSLVELFPEGRDRDHARAAERGNSPGANLVLRLRRHDGTFRDVSMVTMPLHAHAGDVHVHWLIDRTEHLRAVRDAAGAEVRQRSIVRSLADSVIIIDEHGLIQSFSPSAEKTFGYAAAEVVGRNVSVLMPAPDRTLHDAYLEEYVQSGWATGGREKMVLTGDAHIVRPERETIAMRKDGSIFPARLMVSEVDTGSDRFFVGLLSDITKQKRDAEEVRLAKEKAEEARAIIAVQKRRMQEELDVGRRIQLSMVPGRFPDLAGTSVWGLLRPAREVGGDFYDLFQTTDDELWICIGDVSGKGVPAALLMAVTKTLIKAFATQGFSPAEVLTRVNDELSADNDSAMFVTVFVARLECASGMLHYTNAGHNPPLVRRASGSIERYAVRHGAVIGAVEGVRYGESTDRLHPGDAVLLFTDGVVEALDAEGRFFTDAELTAVVRTAPVESARQLASAVVRSVDGFADGAEQSDDITLLSLVFDHSPMHADADSPRLQVRNSLQDVATAVSQVATLVAQSGGDRSLQESFAIVFDELLSNIVRHAYPDDAAHVIECEIRRDDASIVATIVDDGDSFNPLEYPVPDTSAPLEERAVGGVGLHLVRRMMDDMRYERRDGRNVLTLIKSLAAPGAPPEPGT